MFDRLEVFEKKYEECNQKLYDPAVVSDPEAYAALMKEVKGLEPVVEKYKEYKKQKNNEEEAKQMLAEGGLEKDFREMVELELGEARESLEKISEELKILLLPKDPNDDRNVIVEIRGGAGGEEAALFSASLFRMYSMYAETKRWKTEILNANETELGGYKEISFMITGEGAYSRMKYESGGHRVQRVPETETQGRIHTSTVTVAVLPEAEDVVIDDKDDMYNIGDEIDVKTVEYGTDREYIEKCYTVNSVKLYDTAAEVDGISDNLIEIDFHVIISYGVSIAAVADNLIENVKYKVSEFTGLEIKKINIYVEGVRVID